jgi:Ca-activated chloride channel family protein
MKRLSLFAVLAVATVLLAVPGAWAQGVLVVINPPHPTPLPRPIPHSRPEPPASYKIKELDYHAKITDQVAQVSLTQSFVNTGSRQMEVAFVFPLPYDAAIDRLTFMVDGKEYDAKLLDAKEARKTYEEYVRKACDPALLEWVGWGMLKTSVFPVPPGAERKVTLRFSQLLRKDGKLTDLIIPLSTAKYTSSPVEKLKVQVAIETTHELKNVYSPTHSPKIERPDEKHAVVKFEAKDTVPTTDFRLFFDSADGKLGASVVSYRPEKDDEGFFLLLASPEIKSHGDERPAKTVVFVVDRSGSMSGKKIDQAKEALKFVLNNLRKGDTFNIVAYDSSVESFRPELQKYDDETRKAALGFIEGLYAGGSTNIDGALKTALGMIEDDSRPNFVLFLTDGLPTVGERNEAKIVENAHQHNKHRARLIDFGVGYDVNSRLLDRLSRENFGQSEYVRPDEDIEAHVSRVYQKFAAPVMTDVAVEIEVDDKSGSRVTSRVYPKHVYDLFAGEQLVMVGRYKRAGEAKVTITGKVGGKKQKFDFPARLVQKSHDQSLAFVEKLWAMRRIGEIIDEIDLHGKNDELVKELVGLSTKHGILTPYTSFLADENSAVRDLADVRLHMERARTSLDSLGVAEGVSGFSQRAQKFNYQNADTAPAAAAPAFGGQLQRQVAESGAGAAGSVGRMAKQPPLATASAGYVPALQAGGQGQAASNSYREIDSDRLIVANGVQNAGNETLYKRGQTWIANNAKDIDPAKIQEVKRFSDEYFALVGANTPDENVILAAQQEGEELLVRFRGQAYLIK